jgi:hypothetical protein
MMEASANAFRQSGQPWSGVSEAAAIFGAVRIQSQVDVLQAPLVC